MSCLLLPLVSVVTLYQDTRIHILSPIFTASAADIAFHDQASRYCGVGAMRVGGLEAGISQCTLRNPYRAAGSDLAACRSIEAPRAKSAKYYIRDGWTQFVKACILLRTRRNTYPQDQSHPVIQSLSFSGVSSRRHGANSPESIKL